MCRQHVVDVRDEYQQFQQAGGDVVVITMGSPPQVARFRERLQLPFTCLSDPDRVAYRAFSVPEGSLGQVAGPGMWRKGLSALWRAGIGIPQAHPYQLHAAFVIDRHGVIRFAYRPATSVVFPNHDEMRSVMQGAN